MGIPSIRYTPIDHQDIWSKAQDYLYELSVYERIMAEALFVNNYELALKSADIILGQISFLLVDHDPKNANKIIKKGLETEMYKKLNKKITDGLKYAMIANSGVKGSKGAAYYAYNIAREVYVELKNAINSCDLYFKKGGNPNTSMSRGLSGA